MRVSGENFFHGLMNIEWDARMRTGVERRTHADTAVFEAMPNDWLCVTYGHKRTDHIPKVAWTEACAELKGAPMDYADFAAYYPTAFWLYHYYGLAPTVLDGLVNEWSQ
jgi:hypothetical protein